jgi:hypothetical protein
MHCEHAMQSKRAKITHEWPDHRCNPPQSLGAACRPRKQSATSTGNIAVSDCHRPWLPLMKPGPAGCECCTADRGGVMTLAATPARAGINHQLPLSAAGNS